MSLLVRAALLGGLAYVVSRAVRSSQQSLESSRSQATAPSTQYDDDESELQPQTINRLLATSRKNGDRSPHFLLVMLTTLAS